MRQKFKHLIVRKNIENVLETAYMVAFVLWISYAFLGTTTFEIEWTEHFLDNIRTVIIALILVRVGYSEKYNRKEAIVVIGLCLIFSLAAERNGYEVLTDVLILILGAKGISFRKIMKVYFVTTILLLVYTIGAALTGRIENLVYYQESRRTRTAFGSVYPTDFSAHIFYSILVYFYLRNEKLKYVEMAIAALLGVLVYWFCDARLNTICIFGAVLLFAFHKFIKDRRVKMGKPYEMNTVIAGLLATSATICASVMISLTIFYNSGNKFIALLDNMLSSRLRLGHKGIDIYQFSFWGQYIPMRGLGGTVEEAKHYFFLDSSYLYIVLQYGLLVLGAVLFMWLLIGIKAKVQKEWSLLLIIGIIAVQSMVEHHMLNIAYNPFLWALFAKGVQASENYAKGLQLGKKLKKIGVSR